MSKKNSYETIKALRRKALTSPCTYKLSGIALDKKGDVLGIMTNGSCRNWNVLDKVNGGRPGTGVHVERRLLARYGSNVKTIIIMRTGRGGDILPINPCKVCQKVADKYGVKIVTIDSDEEKCHDGRKKERNQEGSGKFHRSNP